ncbi:hypothetical protein [Oharaeibacter diazotrophicus]|uniref:SMODS and SLOG-associating 2TM effector domain-containing protein n=1 Tax=Oharaeibacter diazotrophicus TaxID=1920512 RepID=A0A4V3CW85_9HYPH|nr:hypothetical protein [Oharaeibacter diazotrophicus]TDP85368.1 hypothetical protein EDD54_2221 [Oharaeibacter diazotrophicus]BBE74338.1 hypothetical protein OHA_1_03969 [Pleomorphomonas sp. SM30]GLS75971.1 hypothetical protein GCM10007904_13060 [Oharaeibacter diazotrophicus]
MGHGESADAEPAAAGPAAAALAEPAAIQPAGGAPARTLTERLKAEALRCALYNGARRNFYEVTDNVLKFATVLTSSGAIAAFGHEYGAVGVTFSIVAAVSAAVDLVFGLGRKAAEHAVLQRRFHDLMADIVEAEPLDAARAARFEGCLHRLYGEERPAMRAVDVVAYNAAQASLFGETAKRLAVTRWQALTRHLLPHNAGAFPEVR